MTYQHSLRKVLLTAAFVVSIGLMGCDTAAPTATVVPAPPATATIGTGGSEPVPTRAEATATTAPVESAPTTESAPTATAATNAAEPTATTSTSAAEPTATTATTEAAACTKLNLNAVTEAQLMAGVPGFNSRWVREFMEYRPYVSIQQFRRELGKYTDAAQISEWETYVYVPVSPTDSDAATLQQLPGVDAIIAAALVAGRPYATNAAFLTALGAQVSAAQLAEAQCYLAAAATQ